MFYFSAFPPIQLASSFCLLEQIFFFSTFSSNSACFSFLPVGANVLFSISLPQVCFILQYYHWSNHSSYTHFTPSLLASLFCLLEQMYCFLSLCPKSASSSSITIGATTLHIHTLLQACLLLFSACWSKCTVFYLFAPSLLHPPVLPLEQQYFISTLYSKPACFFLLPIGANILFSTFSPIQLASFFSALGDFPLFWLFPPIRLHINLRLHSNHPRSGLTSASSVYRWIHTSQVQIVQIQSPHR